ncbi:GGDEF domain-containing protein [Gluconobacter kondonii]|uniref:GGDEF domain-containing protein n=1 Tax=Gluconobacter kondonii TaxID=941463 RepID=UPI001B8B3B16|nr:GGDEF domain-containing protein [Gluconobacter kondonii]MBS1065973.1 GGDEF domain-containing protein [Gluconobacter kondonii]
MTWTSSNLIFDLVVLVSALIPLGWLPIWLQDRQRHAIFWGMIAASVFAGSMLCRVILPFFWAIAIANAGILMAHTLVWVGCRSLRKHSPKWYWFFAPSSIWIILCFLPKFENNINTRFSILIFMSILINILAIREISNIKNGRIFVRGWIIGLFIIEIIGKVTWLIWVENQPENNGLILSNIPGFSPMFLTIMIFILLLGPALSALDKEVFDMRQYDDSRKDFVTGVGNRRYFEEMLGSYFSISLKYKIPLSLMMVDVDYFKQYNDIYGHPAGDICLHKIAEVIQRRCRSADLVGRYGGEEFAILLPGADLGPAQEIAQRIIVSVRELQIEHKKSPKEFATISIGIANMKSDSNGISTDNLIKMADIALYRAKDEGRDRFCVFS